MARAMSLRALLCPLSSLALAVSFASPGHAVDGAIEISPAAIAAYPYVIPAAGTGKYVLTGNLVPPPGPSAIVVFASNVEIDLNGFSITGAAANPFGIDAALPVEGLTVRNGTITGFGVAGIDMGSLAKIVRVKLSGNAVGLDVTPPAVGDCLVIESVVSASVGAGIDASNCKIEDSVITGNGGAGIVGMNNVILHNQINGNGGGGILTGGGGVIQGNVLMGNGPFGISDGAVGPAPVPPPVGPPRTTVIANRVEGSLGPGINLVVGPAVITDNVVSSNFADGIFCAASCAVRGNVVESNNLGGILGSGGVNVAAGSNVNQNAINFNLGFGLTLPLTAAYSQNAFFGNGPVGLGPHVVPTPGPPHPTSGFANLCGGIPGPAPTCP